MENHIWSDGEDGVPMDHPLEFSGHDWYSEKDADHDWYSEKDAEKEEEYEKAYISQNLRSAEAALKYYNKKRGTNYELVEALGSNGGLYDGIWVHCNFKAKKVVDGISSTKLFFGELEGGESGFIPAACRILRGKDTADNCEMCPAGGVVIHPRNAGFHLAQYKRRRRSSRVAARETRMQTQPEDDIYIPRTPEYVFGSEMYYFFT